MHSEAPSRNSSAGLAGRWPATILRLRRSQPLEAALEQFARERDRLVLWLPVAFGFGVVIYFALPREPPAMLVPAAAAAAAMLIGAGFARRASRTLRLACLPLACLLAGLGTGKLRTELVTAPVLARSGTHTLEGRIALVEPRGDRVRLLLEEPAIAGLAPERTPMRVRITAAGGEGLRPGMRLRVRARLSPPSGPTWPRGYDYARRAWFERLGAIGHALGAPVVIAPVERLTAADAIAHLRRHIAERARTRIGGEPGGVAAALLTGLRGDIPDRVWRAMQASGLAHLLAISGLHLGLVAGAVFFAARYLFAAIPPLALRLPARKPAALVALLASFLYLLLAGAPVPTRRAFVMIAVALVALVIDRNPFSMRLVAIAATVVLLLQPESVVSVSFQMSFAAVVALIAWFERSGHPAETPAEAGERGPLVRLRDYALLVLTTTLVATVATLPFAAFHFQRVALWGVLANLLAVPLTAFWIMPAGLLALALLPFGLDGPAFDVMGAGVAWLLAVAGTVASLPGASLPLAAWPDAALVLFVLGGLWLAIWQRPWRLLGLPPMAAALLFGLAARPPDLLAAPWLDQAALRAADGTVLLHERVRNAFLRRQWRAAMLADEVRELRADVAVAPDVACDPLGCVLDRGPGARVALVLLAGALAEDCRRADLVITALRVRRCEGPARLVDGPALRRAGGVAVWLEEGGYRLETVAERRGERPWTRTAR